MPGAHDYPEWTEYSHGNPNCWRRIYCDRLLYVIPDARREWTWHDANVKPFTVHRGFVSKLAAMRAAEQWAEQQ